MGLCCHISTWAVYFIICKKKIFRYACLILKNSWYFDNFLWWWWGAEGEGQKRIVLLRKPLMMSRSTMDARLLTSPKFWNFLMRGRNLEHWKNMWFGVPNVSVWGWRAEYGEMFGMNLARLAGKQKWLNWELCDRWENLMNHGLVVVCEYRQYVG